MLVIKGGTINDSVTRYPYQADIVVDDAGTIAQVEPKAKLKGVEDAEVVDATGLAVYPGLVDASSALGRMGNLADEVPPEACLPQLRALDGVSMQDPAMGRALRAGVTTACTSPSLGGALDGTSVAFRMEGEAIDDAAMNQSAFMEATLDADACMQQAALLREMLHDAVTYASQVKAAQIPVKKGGDSAVDEGKLPDYDMCLEALRPVVEGELALRVRSREASCLLTADRIAREFGIRIVLEYEVERPQAASKLAQLGRSLVLVPAAINDDEDADREAAAAWEAPEMLAGLGSLVVIATGPGLEAAALVEHARRAAAAGMGEFEALQAITEKPAQLLGVGHRVGSIAKGRVADLLLVEGDLFAAGSKVREVISAGKRVAME